MVDGTLLDTVNLVAVGEYEYVFRKGRKMLLRSDGKYTFEGVEYVFSNAGRRETRTKGNSCAKSKPEQTTPILAQTLQKCVAEYHRL